jgi:hypothetical protein
MRKLNDLVGVLAIFGLLVGCNSQSDLTGLKTRFDHSLDEFKVHKSSLVQLIGQGQEQIMDLERGLRRSATQEKDDSLNQLRIREAEKTWGQIETEFKNILRINSQLDKSSFDLFTRLRIEIDSLLPDRDKIRIWNAIGQQEDQYFIGKVNRQELMLNMQRQVLLGKNTLNKIRISESMDRNMNYIRDSRLIASKTIELLNSADQYIAEGQVIINSALSSFEK